MTETVTIELPESVYQSARRLAEATGMSLDAVLQASIARTVPPLDDVPADQAADLAALALLDDGALWRAARATMPPNEQTEMHELLDSQGVGDLDSAGKGRLDELLAEYGLLTVRKAHAYMLLARRGYRVPPQEFDG